MQIKGYAQVELLIAKDGVGDIEDQNLRIEYKKRKKLDLLRGCDIIKWDPRP
eukprot:gene21382-25704_t